MKRMLINATHSEELRVAMVDGQQLFDLDIESRAREQKKANIYKARITRVEPSLEAAFVDFGANRHGFLPLKEISREYFTGAGAKGSGRVNIKDVVREGTEIIVQVEKEERGNKGAALTTFYSLAGRYLVLMPNNPRAGGISRRIEGDERTELKDTMAQLEIPKNMGAIIRTAGVGRGAEELQSDLDYLTTLADTIAKAADAGKAPFLIYQENNIIIRAIRDYLRDDIGEILIDTQEAFDQATEWVERVMPQFASRIKFYDSEVPLFSRYQIEGQIESAFQREVRLPSGGSIVIDPTEALVSIDINSSRATKGADIEETALNTNLESADEICRQMRLRDIGGLIVIDFIDMNSPKNQRAVENRMRDALEVDRARVQVGRISRFGLLEMSRQRLRPSLGETSGIVCPRCSGLGTIRDVESSALAIMRLVEEEAMKETSSEIRAFLPIAVASYLLNEKRSDLTEIEKRTEVRVVVVPSADLETPHYRVERIRASEDDNSEASYEIASELEAEVPAVAAKPVPVERAVVQAVAQPRAAALKPVAPKAVAAAPLAVAVKKPGLFGRLMSLFSVADAVEEVAVAAEPERKSSQNRNGNRGSRKRPENRNRNDSRSDNRTDNRGNESNRDSQKDNAEKSGEKSAERNGRPPRGRRSTAGKNIDVSESADATIESTEEKTEKRSRTRRPERRPGEDQGPADADKRNQGSRQRSGQRKRSQRAPAETTASELDASKTTADNADNDTVDTTATRTVQPASRLQAELEKRGITPVDTTETVDTTSATEATVDATVADKESAAATRKAPAAQKESAAKEQLAAEQEPATKQEPAVETLSAVEEAPVDKEEPAAEEPATVVKTPLVADIAPAAEETPEAKKEPVVEEQPVAEQAPVAEEQPVAEQAPVAKEEPAAEEQPAAEQAPVAKEAPVAEQAPVAREEPAAEEQPVAEQAPVVKEAPAAEQAPVAKEEPVAEQASVAKEVPVVKEAPTTVQAPQAAAAVAHPSQLGRAANDPRVNPTQALQGPVLTVAPTTPAAQVLSAEPRQLDAAHPSNRGRVANDPRATAETTA
jgi:ribonuclease E